MDTITKKIRNIWSGMIQRCYNPSSRGYRWYGSKGITVCDEWRHFRSFEEWALASGFKPGLSIERIDNTKGYTPENCRWITLSDQGKNKTNNHLITMNGETKTLSDWAKHLNIKQSTLSHRLKRGWNEQDALDGRKQVSKSSKHPELDRMIYEKFKTKKQMAKEMGIDYQLIIRITNGIQCPTIEEVHAISLALDVPFMTIANIFL